MRAGETFYHEGFYSKGHNFGGHSWFAKSQQYAAGYVTWGAEEAIARGEVPFLCQFETKVDFDLLLIKGNHVEDLYRVYGRAWNHADLARDTAANIQQAHSCATGLAMAGLDDYLLIDFQSVLMLIGSINDLAIICKIKNT